MTENSRHYSQLKGMLAISRASFRSILRSPSAVVFTLLFPLIFVLVFGFIDGGQLTLDVALDPDSELEHPVFDSLSRVPGLHLIPGKNKAALLQDIQKGNIDAILKIEAVQQVSDTYYRLELTTHPAAREKGIIIRSMLEQFADKLNLKAASIQRPLVQLETREARVREYKTIDFILPGQLGFSLLSSGVFGTAFVFFNLRQTLVIKRFFATPIRKPFIILGEAISRLTFSLLGSVFLITIGHLAFGFTLVNGLVTFLSMLGLAALGLIVFMGFGFVVSGIAKNESTIPPLANVITLPQFLLSGTFFDIENFPTWLQPFCKMLPLTYLNEAMRLVAFEGAGWSELALPVGVVCLWGCIVYGLAVKFFRWE